MSQEPPRVVEPGMADQLYITRKQCILLMKQHSGDHMLLRLSSLHTCNEYPSHPKRGEKKISGDALLIMQQRYLRQQGLVAMQQTVSLAAEEVALSLLVPLLQLTYSFKAALQLLSLLTHPAV